MTAPIHAGMQSPSKPPAEVHELANPRPVCRPCSRTWHHERGITAAVLVESALIIRDPSSGLYRAICHCHGASYIVELGPTTSEKEIAASRAF